MNRENPGMAKVVDDLISKTKKDEADWRASLSRRETAVGSLKFCVENFQDKTLTLLIYKQVETKPVPGRIGPTEGEVLNPEFLGGFTADDLPCLRILMDEILFQERRRPEYQRRMREVEKTAKARTKREKREQKKAVEQITQLYFS